MLMLNCLGTWPDKSEMIRLGSNSSCFRSICSIEFSHCCAQRLARLYFGWYICASVVDLYYHVAMMPARVQLLTNCYWWATWLRTLNCRSRSSWRSLISMPKQTIASPSSSTVSTATIPMTILSVSCDRFTQNEDKSIYMWINKWI